MRIHIGEKIKQRSKELRIGPTELARHISTSKQNVYGIFKRESIDTELLQKISKALNLDFFCYYFDHKLPMAGEEMARYVTRSKSQNDQGIAEEAAALKKELSEWKEKYELAKRILELTDAGKSPVPKKYADTRKAESEKKTRNK
jgi:transcriptional regulator with XRE-family HTH domain